MPFNPIPVVNRSDAGRDQHAPLVPRDRFVPFALVTALFFLWAIPNNFNDILIRQFMKSFEINRLQAGLVQFAFYLGYFFLAFPAGVIMRRAGYKTGIVIGLCLYGVGCILFYPAAHVGQYWFFLTALFVIASGLAFLETGASPFIIQIGDPETAAQRVNFSQSFNPLGSITAVLIGSQFIFSGIELKPDQVAALQAAGTYQAYLKSETLRVVTPYLVLGTLVLLWAVLIARTPFPHTGMDYSRNTLEHDTSKPLWRRKHFVFAVLAQFLYVGAQVGAWSWQIPYVQTYTGLGERKAGYLLTAALVAFTTGRFFSTWLLRHVRAARLLGIYAVLNAIICSIAVLAPGWIGVICLVATSFFMSLMYPTIFALGVKGLGTHTKTGGAVIVMSIVGGAAIPPLMGRVADMTNVAVSYAIPVLCFVGVLLYAWLGSAPDVEEVAAEPGLAAG
ncbi:MAG TPA: L-fucose:H+ symporter permease [Terracidiphilus sp.]|jgi:FHS family L-fucose permease-like MFS transporter